LPIIKASPENIRLFTTDHPDIPVPNKQRIQYLDILRGIAILFILVANIRYLSGEYFIPELKKAAMVTASLDHVMEILAFIFVDGKFYSVFSILFGIGFAVQYQRMNKEDKIFVPFFRRRMLGLLIIGSVHLFLIWLGDILTLYALLGFTLIWFRHFSNKRLLIWTGVLLLMPVVHWLVMYLTDNFYPHIFSVSTMSWLPRQAWKCPVGKIIPVLTPLNIWLFQCEATAGNKPSDATPATGRDSLGRKNIQSPCPFSFGHLGRPANS
jgi:hypothetical protein